MNNIIRIKCPNNHINSYTVEQIKNIVANQIGKVALGEQDDIDKNTIIFLDCQKETCEFKESNAYTVDLKDIINAAQINPNKL